jgi:hypothetical protein
VRKHERKEPMKDHGVGNIGDLNGNASTNGVVCCVFSLGSHTKERKSNLEFVEAQQGSLSRQLSGKRRNGIAPLLLAERGRDAQIEVGQVGSCVSRRRVFVLVDVQTFE